MKKVTQLLYMLLSVATFSACMDDDKGKVITQDVSYQPDADYIYVDIPEKFQFDPSNIVYLQGSTVLKLNGKYDGEHLNIVEGTEFAFNVGLKEALAEDILVSLKYDRTLLDEYQNTKGLIPFPEENVLVSEVKLAAGTQAGKITLALQDVDALNEMPGYILPFRLEFVDAVDGVKISSNSYCVFVELQVIKDNIDSSNDPIEGVLFNDNVLFESNKSEGLEKLHDGSTGGYWFPDSESIYLSMTFLEPTKVIGFKIDVRKGYYLLGSFNVYVDEGDGYISYGKVERNTGGTPIYVRFKKPVEIKSVKLDGMVTVNGNTEPDLAEITFIR